MEAPPVIRIVSYNVHACIGGDGEFRPDRIVDVLAGLDADIIGLQEVEERQYGGQRISDFLAEHLGMEAYRGPTLRRRTNEYGNLLLTKLPVEKLRVHELSQRGREPRGVIDGLFTIASRSMRVLTTHLGLSSRERARQIEKLLGQLDGDESDIAVLMGDFNEWRPFGRSNKLLNDYFGRQPTKRTFPATRPTFGLDRILVKPAPALSTFDVARTAPATVASDHLPVYADLRLAPP